MTHKPDFGGDDDRIAFLRYLRTHHRFTLEDIAEKSLYSLDTVKAWLTDSPTRRRTCTDRAMSLLLQNLGLTTHHYWAVVEKSRAEG